VKLKVAAWTVGIEIGAQRKNAPMKTKLATVKNLFISLPPIGLVVVLPL
jgi:hypothetical protein